MKHLNKILAAAVILSVCYLVYAYSQLRQELFAVYTVDDKYAYGSLEQTDLTIVDFNKYGCDVCRTLHPLLAEAVRQDGRVRYVPRMITFGDAWEQNLNTAVYAAAEQGKFIEMHDAIYRNWPVDNIDALFTIARGLGLDTQKLSRDMAQPEIKARALEDERFFDAWGVGGTPSLLMGKAALFRPLQDDMSVEILLEKFEQARQERGGRR